MRLMLHIQQGDLTSQQHLKTFVHSSRQEYTLEYIELSDPSKIAANPQTWKVFIVSTRRN